MEPSMFDVVYVDERATQGWFQSSHGTISATDVAAMPESSDVKAREVHSNLRTLLSIFSRAYICNTGAACVAKIRELKATITSDCKPILVIVDVLKDPGTNERREQETETSRDLQELYGVQLLRHISNQIACSNYPQLFVPVALISDGPGDVARSHPTRTSGLSRPASRNLNRLVQGSRSPQFAREIPGPSGPVIIDRMIECLEAGASDALSSPLQEGRVYGLVAHAYRAHKDFLKEKQSALGVDSAAPYAYLREDMVSQLLKDICAPGSVQELSEPTEVYILDHRQRAKVAKAIANWNFSAHDLSEDELVHAAFLMLQHALKMPELEKWRLPAGQLKGFLMACRAAYHDFVLYHNFRHVVDVLQAVFYFLLQLGTLPPYPTNSVVPHAEKAVSPITALLKPVDALTLLVAAIGHDVGHPGVNNGFLMALRAPLAQLYNNSSVLEAFHCAAYSQILRRYWTVAFEDNNLHKLLTTSIMATDMGLHFQYMVQLGNLQQKVHDNKGTDGWAPKAVEECKTLACGLLIKCADISNVARPFDIAARWSDILQLEFARQGEMEKEVGIPTTLVGGPPEIGNVTKLAISQLNFMKMFASPLFDAVTDILPGMQFAVVEIEANQTTWQVKIEEEKAKNEPRFEATRYSLDGFQSPRSGSPDRIFAASPESAISPESSHPEGLPASGSSRIILSDELLTRTLQSVAGISPPQSSLGSSSVLNTRRISRPQSHEPARHPSPSHQSVLSNAATQAPLSSSRRSSGAYPAANILTPGLSSRRSSNTVPTQLHLGFGSTSGDPAPKSAENVQLASQYREGQSISSSKGTDQGSFGADSNYSSSVSTGAIGGAGNSHRGSKDSEADNGTSSQSYLDFHHISRSHAERQSTQQSSGRLSGFSSQDRHSNATSGAHTVASHILPTSPTGTQATSFLTDNSETGLSDDGPSVAPEIMDMERPGNSRFPANLDGACSSDEIVAAAPHTNGHTPTGGGRVVRKKNSRFRFDFWKKKYREGGMGSLVLE
ncbi:3',5'-cyclic-nucleotide phosphodiesterase [Lambiella insularis]|nr:3',5'-cyclic-nucleotide phosphodiesterase [Lambiella insularis]